MESNHKQKTVRALSKFQVNQFIHATGIYCDTKEWEALINPEPPWQAEIDRNNKMIKRLRKQNAEYKRKLEQL